MNDVLGDLSARIGDEFSHPLMDARGDERYLVVLMTADKGLAGAFNANLIKAGQQFLRDNTGKTVEMMPVGRKGRDFFRRRSITFVSEHVGLTGAGQVNINDAKEIAQNIIRTFTEDETIDKVFLIFSEFKSVLSQRVVVEQLLPVVGKSEEGDTGTAPDVDYIYEQEPGELFSRLLPRLVETQIYRGMLESVASEQGARMTAMDSASKNAGELIDTLTLNMNRIRQAAITKEIIEVVSGAAAL
jgi:F-type H+-transporting ATPase subunit gamma